MNPMHHPAYIVRMRSLARAAFHLVALAAVFAVMACSTQSPIESYPDITFGHRAPIQLDVGRVVVENRYQPPLSSPNLEHLAPVQPATAMSRWANDRMVAAGREGMAVLRIETARIVEVPLGVRGGIGGVMRDEQSRRFDLELKASVEAIDLTGRATAIAEVEVVRSRTLNEAASLRERDRVLFELTEQAMQMFDEQMERQIRQHLTGVLL
jgi:hypothetical protein